MTKYIVNNANNPIVSQMKKNRLQKSDICRLLDITQATVNNYINDPGLIRLRDLYLLSGIFGLNILELVFLLERNKPKIKKADKWYIDEFSRKKNL